MNLIFKIILLMFIIQVSAVDNETRIITDHLSILSNGARWLISVIFYSFVVYLLYTMLMIRDIPNIKGSRPLIRNSKRVGTKSIDFSRPRSSSAKISHSQPKDSEHFKESKECSDLISTFDSNHDIYLKATRYEFSGIKHKTDGNVDTAVEMFNEAASAYELDAIKFYNEGNYHTAGLRYNSAASAYKEAGNTEQAMKMLIRSASAYELAAIHSYNIGDYSSAITYYEKASKAYILANKIHDGIMMYIRAIACCDKLDDKKRATNIYFKIALEYERLADVSRDKELFKTAGQYYEKSANIYEELGNASRSVEMYKKAAEAYAKAGRNTLAAKMQKAQELQAKKDLDNDSSYHINVLFP